VSDHAYRQVACRRAIKAGRVIRHASVSPIIRRRLVPTRENPIFSSAIHQPIRWRWRSFVTSFVAHCLRARLSDATSAHLGRLCRGRYGRHHRAAVAQWLSRRLGQQIIVENRTGAGTNIATNSVVHATPDGYTLLLVTSSNAINACMSISASISSTTSCRLPVSPGWPTSWRSIYQCRRRRSLSSSLTDFRKLARAVVTRDMCIRDEFSV